MFIRGKGSSNIDRVPMIVENTQFLLARTGTDRNRGNRCDAAAQFLINPYF